MNLLMVLETMWKGKVQKYKQHKKRNKKGKLLPIKVEIN